MNIHEKKKIADALCEIKNSAGEEVFSDSRKLAACLNDYKIEKKHMRLLLEAFEGNAFNTIESATRTEIRQVLTSIAAEKKEADGIDEHLAYDVLESIAIFCGKLDWKAEEERLKKEQEERLRKAEAERLRKEQEERLKKAEEERLKETEKHLKEEEERLKNVEKELALMQIKETEKRLKDEEERIKRAQKELALVQSRNIAVQQNAQAQAAAASGNQKPKNKWCALILLILLGWLGVHKFYEGKIVLGVVYILTRGLFFIGVIVDLALILRKPTTYYV